MLAEFELNRYPEFLCNFPELKDFIPRTQDLALGEVLAILRYRIGLRQSDVARVIGCSRAWIALQERNKSVPRELTNFWARQLLEWRYQW